jgi:hypothetical protein
MRKKRNSRIGVSLLVAGLALAGCATRNDDRQLDLETGLTISGPPATVQRLLGEAGAGPHSWAVERRWSEPAGDQAVRLRWKTRPSFEELGSIVVLAKQAAAEGGTISDKAIVETSI